MAEMLEWIMASEKLPTRPGMYLVAYKSHIFKDSYNVKLCWFTKRLVDHLNWSHPGFYVSDPDGDYEISDQHAVEYWMPLPKVPSQIESEQSKEEVVMSTTVKNAKNTKKTYIITYTRTVTNEGKAPLIAETKKDAKEFLVNKLSGSDDKNKISIKITSVNPGKKSGHYIVDYVRIVSMNRTQKVRANSIKEARELLKSRIKNGIIKISSVAEATAS